MGFNYDFETLNPVDFKLILTSTVQNRLIKHIFFMTKKKIKKKTGIEVSGDLEVLEEFDVDPRFHKLLKTNIKKILKNIYDLFKKDSLVITYDYIQKASFIRDKKKPDIWLINIEVRGQYAKE